MKTIYSTLAFFILMANSLFAQRARFVTSGTIEYEKTVNMYAVIKNDMDEGDTFGKLAFEAYQKNNPQFKKLRSNLTFGDNKALYTPIVPEDATRKMGKSTHGTTYNRAGCPVWESVRATKAAAKPNP